MNIVRYMLRNAWPVFVQQQMIDRMVLHCYFCVSECVTEQQNQFVNYHVGYHHSPLLVRGCQRADRDAD